MRNGLLRITTLALLGGASLFVQPSTSEAFCGFYVAGAEAPLYNNATQVVLMRSGETTVISMQNNYEGPPENFAMVVPVPVVLEEGDVKTLPADVFAKVDQLAAPRLVEYWEQDPCYRPPKRRYRKVRKKKSGMAVPSAASAPGGSVVVHARFDVGEYEVVILGADDSRGLDGWLRQHGYNIPEQAEPALRPYVAEGMKFFVARVNADKVRFEKGQAKLSPLRFHYDSQDFKLPIRLGMLNAKDKQDLIVHVLAPGKRYAVANYENVAVPTNLDVKDRTRKDFPGFYASLFDRTLEKHPGAIVTEYAWNAGSCDPCPGPTLDGSDLATLGNDVIDAHDSFVLTRLHARYGADLSGQDLVFAAGEPIAGGREWHAEGGVEQGLVKSNVNNFQARYAIRHEWKGKVRCRDPRYGIWGGPPSQSGQVGPVKPKPAQDLAFAPRGRSLAEYMVKPVSELDGVAAPGALGGERQPYEQMPPAPVPPASSVGDTAEVASPPVEPAVDEPDPGSAGGAGCQGKSQPPVASLGVLLVLGLRRRKRRG
ncbi:MAG: DUF2330 domain-containing protein [Myxococcota bacterium]